MSIPSSLRMAALAAMGAAAALSSAQVEPTPITAIIAEGKNRNQVMNRLRELTNIGPRVTGSPKLRRAQEWAMSQFRRYCLQNVHLEQWGDVPVGFERGDRQIGRMISPFVSDFQFTTMNWTPGTNGPVQGRAVMAPATTEELARVRDSLKGAFVLMPDKVGLRGTDLKDDDLKKGMDAAGIAGRIFGANDERVHSHGNWRDKTFQNRPKDLNIFVRRSDYDRLARNIKFGRDTRVEFDIENRWFRGPIPQYNVIADIPGTERSDEMVIVCGHLDSWNSPGSQGANDNGTGSVVAIEAARILSAVKAKPKRTIRFILWSGEEQGLLGSRGYVEKHLAEMPKVVAVLNDDGGSGYQGGYSGLENMKGTMEAAFGPTARAFPEFPMEFSVVQAMPSGGSSDHAPFVWEGVPAFFTFERGPKADYGKVWHTQFDRIENSVPEYLVQSSTNHAVVAMSLATYLEPMAHFEKPKRNAVNLQAVGADHVYEAPGTHDHDHEDDYTLELIDRLRRISRALMSIRSR